MKTFLRELARRAVEASIHGVIGALRTIRGSDAVGDVDMCGRDKE